MFWHKDNGKDFVSSSLQAEISVSLGGLDMLRGDYSDALHLDEVSFKATGSLCARTEKSPFIQSSSYTAYTVKEIEMPPYSVIVN